MIKNKLTFFVFLCLFLFPLTFSSNVISRIPTTQEIQSTFNPIVSAEEKMDINGNKIHDHLEVILQNGFVSDVYTTIATFDRPITQEIIDKIKSIGGEVITTWSVIYGAAIKIKGTNLFSLSTIPEITFVTENYRCHAALSTSVPQMNVRPYVWNTLCY